MKPFEPNKKYKRLSLIEWAEAEIFWKSGAHTLEELSFSFGVITRALQSHFKKHGVLKGSEAGMIIAAAQERVRGKEIGDLARRMELARASQATTFENATRLESMIMAQITLSEREPTRAFACMGVVKMLALAATTVERLASLKMKVLNVPTDDPEDLPKIEFFDLTQEDLETIRKGNTSGGDDEEEDYVDATDSAEALGRDDDDAIIES